MATLQKNQSSKETDDSVLKKRISPSQSPVALMGAIHNTSTVQRAKSSPSLLGTSDVMRLQRMIGNQAVGRLLTNQVQRQATEMDEEALLAQPEGGLTEMEMEDEVSPMQAEEELQMEDGTEEALVKEEELA